MSSAGVGTLCFIKPRVNAAAYQEILEHFMLPSTDELYGDADFIFQKDLAPALTARSTKACLSDHGITMLDWPANPPDLNPIKNLWGIAKRKMMDVRPNNAAELKAAIEASWSSITPQQCHRLIASMSHHIEAVIHAKGAKTNWLVIAVGLVRAYLAKGSYHNLYYSIEKPLKFFQTGALLEILHCMIGIVPSSVVLTAFQVMSRVFLIWAVTHSVKEVQSEDSVLLFVIAWTVTEIIRYSFYTFSLLNHLPYIIKWARYTFFILLYPMGVSGELLTIYAALPFVRQSGLYSIRLPNKYNFSFDYYTFLILTMISYIPRTANLSKPGADSSRATPEAVQRPLLAPRRQRGMVRGRVEPDEAATDPACADAGAAA
ncbi:hypothetical protein JRQ81_001831 [Phrynocephalus forsythii]|uniref:Very-long-chain (3R)-3-hydroxyacyl-CoA dehydratase n=1 Tax=Phrynocephalus forsythii TaxID=171643 RepID=A0A9Q0YB71_9SAUR|nr:hypothetical protein JRQ81_001831 [Phrynocephalus forsythii]